MARKTKQNKNTSPELLKQVNPENLRLLEDFLNYLTSINRAEGTIKGYCNDIEGFFVYCLQNLGNKFYVDLSKRDIVAYQNHLLTQNKNSPARIRRIKSALSSMGNFVETILDDEFEGFRPIVRKIESPANTPVREKTVLTDEHFETLAGELIRRKEYEKACCAALAFCSGRRKSELVRFKAGYFTDNNVIYGSLYKTPEKILTKGRNGGKPLTCYVLQDNFKPYFNLWMKYRKENNVESEWLFPNRDDPSQQIKTTTLDSWADVFSRILGIDFYWHATRHFFTTHLSRSGLPDSVIKIIIGWDSLEMVDLYKDFSDDEEIGKYFADGKIIARKEASLSDL